MVRLRRSAWAKRSYRRHRAQRSIAKAWRARRRRRAGGLVARTAVSNLKKIRRLNKNIETKMIQSVSATTGNNFGGQKIQPIKVDKFGHGIQLGPAPLLDTPVYLRPLSGMENGDLVSQRTGAFIEMKSLTYKVQFTVAAGSYNRVGCFIVLDRDPQSRQNPDLCPTNNAVPAVTNAGTILDGVSVNQWNRYQDMNNCSGPNCRFKVLKHLKGQISSTTLNTTGSATCLFQGTLKGKYKFRYDDVAGASEPLNQQLLIMPYSDASTVLTSPTFEAYCRVRFKDA